VTDTDRQTNRHGDRATLALRDKLLVASYLLMDVIARCPGRGYVFS